MKSNSINFDELPSDARFAFMAIMQVALRVKDMGMSQDQFLEFCKGCWESIELNDPDKLQAILMNSMMEDAKQFLDKGDL